MRACVFSEWLGGVYVCVCECMCAGMLERVCACCVMGTSGSGYPFPSMYAAYTHRIHGHYITSTV